MISTNTILVSATVFKLYADGTTEKEHVRYAFDVPEYAIRDLSKLQKEGMSNLLDVVGRDHEVLGVISYTDDAGRKHEVKFNYRPKHIKKLTPKGYQTKPTKGNNSGDKLKKGISAVSKAFDKLMGEEPKPKRKQTTKKRNTATKKTKSTKKSTGKKTASKSRKTTKR